MDNNNLLPENEYTEFESRRYLNPNLQVIQTNDFIDKLRAAQQTNNQQINAATQSLGTDVPSNLGGLAGGSSYFTSRFQTPQTSAATANLRAAAQAAALNQALKNEKAVWDKRYQDAYKAYQKRQNDKTNKTITGGVDYEDTGATTGLDAVQDINQYDTTSTVYDSTQQSLDNRSTERNKQIEVTKDSSGNVTALIVNGTPVYGREARARYRYLKNAGLVR